MQKIHRLPPHEAHKIAAGEVVERPANVVKELLENALDAGATQITLYIEDGGKELIRIIDNGCGMSSEDARLCIENHATSKIHSVDDLSSLQTFGFRGEALSSISAVSLMSLITKEADVQQGISLTIDAGTVIQETLVSANEGTDITIRSLFFNVPARRKFLKKRETEFNQIQQLFQAFCLVYTNVHFKLFHDNRLILNCPPAQAAIDRFGQLWERDISHHMIPLQHADEKITITGAVSNHHYFRYDRSTIFIFVNNRWVKNYALSKALLKGYMNVLPAARYPAAFVHLKIDADLVDINIHPRKEEVQFLHPKIVEQALSKTITRHLENHLSNQLDKSKAFTSAVPIQPLFATPDINSAPFGRPKIMHLVNDVPFTAPTLHQIHEPALHYNFDASPFKPDEYEPIHQLSTLEMVAEKPAIITHTQPTFKLIGQYLKTYLLLEQEDGLFLVDQHAAHERVLYELFCNRFENIVTITLLFPQIIMLTRDDVATLLPHLHFFNEHGIILEQLNETCITVQSTPVHIKDQSIEDLIRQFLGWLHEINSNNTTEFAKIIHEKLRAQMACKAAVKAGDELSQEQMRKLLEDLYATGNRFSCPHGRPAGWLLSLHEIEKKFKRKL